MFFNSPKMSSFSLTKVSLLVFFTCLCSRQTQQGSLPGEETQASLENTSAKSFVETKSFLRTYLSDYGLDVHPFKIGWYNEYIDTINFRDYHKPTYPEDTIGFVIFTTPDFIHKVLKPFVRDFARKHGIGSLERFNPYRRCMEHIISEIRQGVSPASVEYIIGGDYVEGTRKFFGMRAAGEVSGGCRFYRRKDVIPDPWPQDKTIYGTCIHPRYAGWTVIDAVIFPELQYPGLLRLEPDDVVSSRDLRIELLEKVSNELNASWRNISYVGERYSEEHMMLVEEGGLSRDEWKAMIRGWVEE